MTGLWALAALLLLLSEAAGLLLPRTRPGGSLPTPTVEQAKGRLLKGLSRRQSSPARAEVESAIEQLVACGAPIKRPFQGGVFRTVWTSVSANTLLGVGSSPSLILGGTSYQVIDPAFSRAENVVLWKLGALRLRMVGGANLAPEAATGSRAYGLSITGLEFRWGAGGSYSSGCPEQRGLMGAEAAGAEGGRKFTVLDLRGAPTEAQTETKAKAKAQGKDTDK